MWSDHETEQDFLGFTHLVKAVTDVVARPDLLPATIGVYGDWGSGKSSLLKMVAASLKDRKEFLVPQLNGWLFEGYDDAKSALMETILDEIASRKTLTAKGRGLVVSLIRRVNWLRLAGKAVILKQELDRIDEEYADDNEYDEATTDAVETASLLFVEPTEDELTLLKQMRQWAEKTSCERGNKYLNRAVLVPTVPEGWALLPPGDAALSRRVKEAGDHWLVQEKKGRKVFSRGVWAPTGTIDRIRAELEAERSTEGYTKKKEGDARRRDKAQAIYVEDFFGAVVAFLAFHRNHADLADRLARAVTDHATLVGSGTVARTRRIPVEQRAEAAVIAWLRHQTTGYDGMVIPRIKGKRREVRRMLAARSKELLARYRRGEPVPEGCSLERALSQAGKQTRG